MMPEAVLRSDSPDRDDSDPIISDVGESGSGDYREGRRDMISNRQIVVILTSKMRDFRPARRGLRGHAGDWS